MVSTQRLGRQVQTYPKKAARAVDIASVLVLS